MLMAGMRTRELLEVIEQRPTWSVTTTTYEPSHKPIERHRSLIRCEYCDMSYDGNEHENCPHCLAPRPKAREDKSNEARLYSDNRLYCIVDSGQSPHA